MNEETKTLTAEAVAEPTGVKAADAVPQTAQDPASPEASFEDLIRGPYKAQYEARLQEVLRKRLKNTKATVDRYEAMLPTLELLAGKYGIGDPMNVEALHAAVRGDDRVQKAEAMEERVARNAFRDLKKLEQENQRLRQQLLPAAMAYAARQTEQRLTNHIAAGNARPTENGMAGQGAVTVSNDVSRLSRAQRQDIIRRVQSGEKIRF